MDAARAPHRWLVIFWNRGKTLASRLAILAEIEDIFKWRRRWELNHGVLLGILRDGRKIITSESLFGID